MYEIPLPLRPALKSPYPTDEEIMLADVHFRFCMRDDVEYSETLQQARGDKFNNLSNSLHPQAEVLCPLETARISIWYTASVDMADARGRSTFVRA